MGGGFSRVVLGRCEQALALVLLAIALFPCVGGTATAATGRPTVLAAPWSAAEPSSGIDGSSLIPVLSFSSTAGPMSAGPPSLSGVVWGPGGEPAANVRVETIAQGKTVEVATNEAGEYVVPLYPGQEFNVEYQDGSRHRATILHLQPPSEGPIFENIRFPNEGTVTVLVSHADGTPAQGVPVSADSGEVTAETEEGTEVRLFDPVVPVAPCTGTTSAAGTCEFVGPVGEGTYFHIRPHGGTESTVFGTPTAEGNTVTAQLASEPSVSLRGVVWAPGGEPAANVRVETIAQGKTVEVATNEAGEYVVPLYPGQEFNVEYQDGSRHRATILHLQPPSEGPIFENIRFPNEGTVTVLVSHADGTPAQGVPVSADSGEVTAETEEGTEVRLFDPVVPVAPCTGTTSAAGTCEFVGPVGEGTYFHIRPHGELESTVFGTPTAEGNTVTAQLASEPSVSLRGVVWGPGGEPAANVRVETIAQGKTVEVATNEAGEYVVPLYPGQEFNVEYQDGSRHRATILHLQPPSEGPIFENIRFPNEGTVTVLVRDANESIVPFIPISADSGEVTAETEEGTEVRLFDPVVPVAPCTGTTSAAGTCEFVGPVGEGTYFHIRPHGELESTVFGTPTAEGNTVIGHLYSYAAIASAGETEGQVTVQSSSGSRLNEVTASSIPAPPENGVAVVGALNYHVTQVPVGGAVKITLTLPSGSNPTNVYKYDEGTYTDISQLAEISGDTVTLTLTDGGAGDEDGVRNGVIVDPVVPVRFATAHPVVKAINPSQGYEAGGTSVTISGSNLQNADEVKVGGKAVSSFTVTNGNSIVATTPPGTGTVDITVRSPGGTSTANPADRFTYVRPGPAPTLTKLSTKKGPAAGGTVVTLTGTNLAGAEAVHFGASAATNLEDISATTIRATTAPGTVGSAEVTATTPSGTSVATSKLAFKYGNPTVERISPNTGPAAGGTIVTVHGSGFATGTGTTEILFGKTVATHITCASTTECTATSPATTKAGAVDIVAVAAGKKSKKSSGDRYSYG